MNFMPGWFPGALDRSIYETDFGRYATGAAPSDWSIVRGAGGYSVETLVGSHAGRALRCENPGAGVDTAIVWLFPPARTDVEVLFRVMYPTATSSALAQSTLAATRVTDGNNYYGVGVFNPISATLSKVVQKFVAGTRTLLASGAEDITSIADGDWVWARFRNDANNLRIKYWEYGTSEPGGWLFETTDGDLTAAGRVGVARRAGTAGQYTWIDYFAVSIQAKTIPVPF